MSIFFAALLGALVRRVWGGLLSLPGGLARALFSLAYMGMLIWAHGWDPWMLCFAPMAFLGFRAGAEDVHDWAKPRAAGGAPYKWKALPGALDRASYYGLPAAFTAALLLGPAPALIVFASGFAAIPCYALGWTIPSRIPRMAQGLELGEVIFGAIFFSAGALAWIYPSS